MTVVAVITAIAGGGGALWLGAGTLPDGSRPDPLSFFGIDAFLGTAALYAARLADLAQAPFVALLAHPEAALVFLLGLSVPVLGLLLLLWKLYHDPRYPTLALLLGSIVLEFLVHVDAFVEPASSAFLALGFTAATTLAIFTHYPLLFSQRHTIRAMRTSWRYRAAVSRLHPDGTARWHRPVCTLVLGALGVVALALAALLNLSMPPETTDAAIRAGLSAPALLAFPLSIVLWRTFWLRRPAIFLGLLTLVGAFAWTALGIAHGVGAPALRYPLWIGVLAIALGQLVADVYHDVQTAEKARWRIRALHHTVRQRADDLKNLMVQAQAANVAKTQFVSSVSHELRTPLTAISGYAQILLEELPEGNSLQEEFLGIIKQSCERLKSLINDLLDMAKVESGRVELQITSVELEPVLSEVTAQLHPLAETKGLQLLRPRMDVETPIVHADPLRLRQVLINLLSNAIKFTERGCVGICVNESTIDGYRGTGHRESAIALRIFDTGIGISESFLKELFEPFSQDEGAYSSTQQGTGLGLSITKELVERMGGTISVESTVGEGTTFTVLLARGLRREARPGRPALPDPEAAPEQEAALDREAAPEQQATTEQEAALEEFEADVAMPPEAEPETVAATEPEEEAAPAPTLMPDREPLPPAEPSPFTLPDHTPLPLAEFEAEEMTLHIEEPDDEFPETD